MHSEWFRILLREVIQVRKLNFEGRLHLALNNLQRLIYFASQLSLLNRKRQRDTYVDRMLLE